VVVVDGGGDVVATPRSSGGSSSRPEPGPVPRSAEPLIGPMRSAALMTSSDRLAASPSEALSTMLSDTVKSGRIWPGFVWLEIQATVQPTTVLSLMVTAVADGLPKP